MQSFSGGKRAALPPSKPDQKLELSLPARRKRAAGSGEGAHSPDFITALARGLDVLRCFRHGVAALGNLDLARLTGLPKPTISRITYTLTELGYLRYHPDTGKYSPGYGVLALGFGLLAGLEVRELAKASMTDLARETGGAVALGAFDGDAMTYVEAIHGSSALYLRLPVGYRATLDSAMGRAYLASLPADECDAVLARLDQGAPAAETIARARAELAQTGCCFAIGEWQSGINAVAVPFTSITGEGVFVMSCGGPASLLEASLLRDSVAPALLAAVAGLAGAPA
ncbi:IclR family transcriptional regulator [Achromobacter mucicolens]|uniref:IclR family transcriptional regulator n=1 Tax=Achromobacter mucicolens TaxID=1389922 RepID=UPI003B9A15B3